MLLLVRHAHAGDKTRWQGPDRLRPLSLAGQAEAAGLVVRLEDYPIWRILTSPTLRCQQTVEPLARDRRLRIEPEVTLGVDADLGRPPGDPVREGEEAADPGRPALLTCPTRRSSSPPRCCPPTVSGCPTRH